MKLYIAPGACSLSPHIVLREAGIPFDMETVDLGAKRTKSGKDFKAINPKGYVPVLELEGGQVLTEGPAIVQYIADQKPASKLAPPAGTHGSLPSPGMAELHHLGDAQGLRALVQPPDARRL